MSFSAGSAAYEVQQAIYRQLVNDGTIGILSRGVFDEIPPNQPFPYITIGELTETDKPNTQLSTGRELTFNIHIWSRAKGMGEMQRIADAIVTVLEDQELFGMGIWVWTLTIFEMFHTFREMDGITRHGVLRFRVRVSR